MHDSRELAELLGRCASVCEYCADACLHEPNVKMLVECIRLNRDCADICRTALNYISRDSEYSHEIIELCARICGDCGDECMRHAEHHEHCRECAEICRECEDECTEYAKA